jgi:hypothetical protein
MKQSIIEKGPDEGGPFLFGLEGIQVYNFAEWDPFFKEIRMRHSFRLLKAIFFVCLFCLIPLAAWPEEILTTDGQKFTGKIIDNQPDFILLEMENGVQVKIDRPQIVYIREVDKEKEFKDEYPILGAGFGFPAVGNLVAGYYFKDIGFKFSGGPWAGGAVQFDLSKKIFETKDWLGNVSVVVGYENISTYATHWFYDGLGFDVNWMGFAAEVDLDSAPNNVPGLVLMLQAGYILRLND